MNRVDNLLSRISIELFGIKFKVVAEYDKIYENIHGSSRTYLQCKYTCACTDTGIVNEWSGRKWYLSDYMTDDEIVKTAWCAFETCVKHEVMESFKVDNVRLFNPHVNFEELLKVSGKEVKRT